MSLRLSVLLVVSAIAAVACTPAKLIGDPLPGALAPNFTLTDGPTGETVTLSALAGRAVLVTFLYTSCVDTCPLTAETIRQARDRLGDSAKNVVLLAVSVDPRGDTPTTTQRFVADHRLEGSLRFLIGPEAALGRVWKAYGIVQAATEGDLVHTDVIYLIDKKERGRVLLRSTVTPDVLAADLRLLAEER
ncbi:MAG TPA: SCO family protein [Candidatus Limnocylindria bacterium]|jgi:protein SCO1/2